MPNNFKSLSEIIYKEKAFENIVSRAKEEKIVEEFNNIFPELVNVAAAVKVSNKTLYLRVENSVWRSELNLKQEAIVNKIKKHLTYARIEKIKFIS